MPLAGEIYIRQLGDRGSDTPEPGNVDRKLAVLDTALQYHLPFTAHKQLMPFE